MLHLGDAGALLSVCRKLSLLAFTCFTGANTWAMRVICSVYVVSHAMLYAACSLLRSLRASCVSICTFVLAKQVNVAPHLRAARRARAQVTELWQAELAG